MATISIQTKKFADLENTVTVPDSGLLLVHDGNGVKTISIERLSSVLTYPGAGAHNAVYRGKHLGDKVTAAQYAAIDAGTFDDLYIGDYWIIDGIIWRIVAFDYYLNTGDIACTVHHVVIVPDSSLAQSHMNPTVTTEGGYVGSDMYINGIKKVIPIIHDAFGASHILNHRQFLVNAVTNGRPSGAIMFDSTVELMTEPNVNGAKVFNSIPDGKIVPMMHTIDKSQFPLFAMRPDLISNRLTYWLRDVISEGFFTCIADHGYVGAGRAEIVRGIRPSFSIKA